MRLERARGWVILSLALACCGRRGQGGDADADPAAPDTSPDVVDEALPDPQPDADAVGEPDGLSPDCPVDNPEWTVGLKLWDGDAHAGYTLFAPMPSTTTHLIDMCGREVHTWESAYQPHHSAYLLGSGAIVRTASLGPNPAFAGTRGGGRVERISWDGDLEWHYEYSSDTVLLHHDIEPMPGGNVLMIAWERKSAAEAVAAGRDPSLLIDDALWPDHVIEVRPEGASGGTIVWEWHAWDHLVQDHDPTAGNHGVVADHPELIDLNYTVRGQADWTHLNAVAYDPGLDQIMVTAHAFHEIWVIDHSTTTEEAAGHSGGAGGRGGDLLYRWGNPETYGAGTDDDRKLFGQHDGHWVGAGLPGAGHVLVFNNGLFRPEGSWSSVDEIATPVDGSGLYPLAPGAAWGPADLFWTYTAPVPGDLYSNNLSGAQRLPGGNTLVTSGNDGTFLEVTGEGNVVWHYVSPVAQVGIVRQGEEVPEGPTGVKNPVFKAVRIDGDHPALAGRDLVPGDYIELPAE